MVVSNKIWGPLITMSTTLPVLEFEFEYKDVWFSYSTQGLSKTSVRLAFLGGRTILVCCRSEVGCQQRRVYNRQSLPWGYILQKPSEICPGRQINVPGSFWIVNKDLMDDQEQIHSIHVPYTGIMIWTSGLEVVFPRKQWSYGSYNAAGRASASTTTKEAGATNEVGWASVNTTAKNTSGSNVVVWASTSTTVQGGVAIMQHSWPLQ